ncbi:MAG: formylglycine-generating enzyme family protein [Candidatus Electrothrix sp. AUS3]|nr:formylglycine-generating enzyme family protein [Candidatus Electrothrix gigas]
MPCRYPFSLCPTFLMMQQMPFWVWTEWRSRYSFLPQLLICSHKIAYSVRRNMPCRNISALLLLSLLAGAPKAAADSTPKAGEVMTAPLTGMELVYLPGGCFQMGSPPDEPNRAENEGPVHEVCLSGFWIGKYEVTQEEWRTVMDSNPSQFQKSDRHPVEQVSWDDTQQFLARLNQKDGGGFRLPTEAEWEYAARAGSSEARYWDRDIDCSRAVYENNPAKGQDSCVAYLLSRGLDSGSTAPVGSYPANAFGLHDMLGNVWEWCADFYGPYYYSRSPKDNPQGPARGTTRIFRGGSWYWKPSSLRAAHRGVVGGLRQDYKGNGLGFRIVRTAQR